jgi:hypothetical protein
MLLGPLRSPFLDGERLAFLTPDNRVVKLDPCGIINIWVLGHEYYVEYAGSAERYRQYAVIEPPVGSKHIVILEVATACWVNGSPTAVAKCLKAGIGVLKVVRVRIGCPLGIEAKAN